MNQWGQGFVHFSAAADGSGDTPRGSRWQQRHAARLLVEAGTARYRMRLSVFFSMQEPMVWNSCTMMTISKTVTSITGVL